MVNIYNAPASNLPVIGVAHFAFNDAPTSPYPSITQVMKMLDNVGARIVRMQIAWSDVELTSGVYKVDAHYDGLIAAIRASGRQIVLMLGYGNSLYTGGWNIPPTTPAGWQAYANCLIALNNLYYGPDVRWEFENEMNNPQFTNNNPSATQYGSGCSIVAPAFKTANAGKGSKLITNGIGSVAGYDDGGWFMGTASSTAGAVAMSNFDEQTIHPYNWDVPEALFAYPPDYRTKANYLIGPIGCTEDGYPNNYLQTNGVVDEVKRANWIVRKVCSAILAGLTTYCVYSLRDTQVPTAGSNAIPATDQSFSFGLHYMDGTPKLAAAALKTLMNALAGTVTYDAEKLAAPGGQNVYRLALRKNGGGVTKILWSEATTSFSWTEKMNLVAGMQDTNGVVSWPSSTAVAVALGNVAAPIILTGT